MGLIKMKALKLLALKTEKEKLSEFLLELGALELRELTPELLKDLNLDEFFTQLSSEQKKTTRAYPTEILDKEKIAEAIEKARQLLQLKSSSFQEKRSLNLKAFKDILSITQKRKIYNKVLAFLEGFEQTSRLQHKLNKLHLEKEKFQKFSQYAEYEQATLDSSVWSLRVGKLSGLDHYERVKQYLLDTEADIVPLLLNEAVLREEKRNASVQLPAYTLFVALKQQEEQLLKILQTQGVETYTLLSKAESDIQLKALVEQENEVLEELNHLKETQKALALDLQSFENLYDALLYEEQHQEVKDFIKESQYFCYLEAFVPAELEQTLPYLLNPKFTVHLMWEDLACDEQYPIALKNHPLVEPYEVVTEMFSLPLATEFDPTPALAPFYFLFFGMMFSDLAYGLILSALTGFMVWGLKVQGNTRKMCLMMFQCGFSAAFWGLLFGGFFGNLLDAITGVDGFLPPLWFNPTTNPMQLIILSVALGFVHIITGLVIKMKILMATGKTAEAWLDLFPWCLILIGLPLWMVQQTLLPTLPEQISLGMMLVGVVTILLFAGRESKNPILRLLNGVGALYGATGYLSDLMSYTRILALCLATGVVAMVVNNIGVMGGFSLVGIVLFIVVALLGHSLNFSLSVLGAYIHSTRLQFVEFFGKFYEGGGKIFSPHQVKTQYTVYQKEQNLGEPKQKSKLKERFNIGLNLLEKEKNI